MASDWSERTARSPRRSSPLTKVSFELSVIDGADEGKTFVVEPGAVALVGSSKVCAIQLADDMVSPRHCSLEVAGAQLRMVDLGGDPRFAAPNVNGVYAREAFLVGGELIRVGQTALVVRRRSAETVESSTSGADSRSARGDTIANVVEQDLPFAPARQEVLAEFERRYVEHALEKAGHNVARAAANSGIAHRYFQVLKSRRKNA